MKHYIGFSLIYYSFYNNEQLKMQVKNKKSLIHFRAPATNNFMTNS